MKQLLPIGFKLIGRLAPSLAAKFALSLFLTPKRHERPEDEREFWNSGRPERLPSGATARVLGEGPRVWFVHGWEGRGSQFVTIAKQTLAAGFSVVCWDGPAHGDTPGSRTNLIQFSKFLEMDLRGEKEVPCGIVGHSLGGAASLLACERGAPSTKLLMIATPSNLMTIFTEFWDLLELPDRSRAAFLRHIEKETGVSVETIDIPGVIQKLPQSIAVIHDRDDKEVPYLNAERFKAAREDVYLVTTSALGHRRILRSPQVAQSVVQFLRAAGGYSVTTGPS